MTLGGGTAIQSVKVSAEIETNISYVSMVQRTAVFTMHYLSIANKQSTILFTRRQ